MYIETILREVTTETNICIRGQCKKKVRTPNVAHEERFCGPLLICSGGTLYNSSYLQC